MKLRASTFVICPKHGLDFATFVHFNSVPASANSYMYKCIKWLHAGTEVPGDTAKYKDK